MSRRHYTYETAELKGHLRDFRGLAVNHEEPVMRWVAALTLPLINLLDRIGHSNFSDEDKVALRDFRKEELATAIEEARKKLVDLVAQLEAM